MRTYVPMLVLGVLAAGACTRGYEEAASVLDRSRSTPVVPTATSSVSPSVASSPSISSGPSASPAFARIEVRSPIEGDDVLSPLVVSGTAVSATGEIVVRVIGADRSELASIGATIDCGASCRGRFRVALAFYTPERQDGAVQVFEVGGAGSIDRLVEVPVTLVPGV